MTFEKVSIWHYHKFRVYFLIRNLFYEIELIKKLRLSYDRVYYYGIHPLLKEFPFADNRIQINIDQIKKDKFSKKTAFNYAIYFLFSSLRGIFQTGKLKKKKHIVIDHSFKQTCLNLNTLKPEAGNYNLQYLFEKIDDQFIIFNDVQIPKFTPGAKFPLNVSKFKSARNTFGGEWILFRGLISWKVRKEFKKATKQYIHEYSEIEKRLNNTLNELILQSLKSLHSSSKLFLFKYLAYKKFFAGHPFKSISSIDENSAGIKSILDAAKANDIITIGIQHGTIHELHPAYIYSFEDKQRNIVPDHTMVWGKH
ncbi:MAG: hypothetical protein K8R68_10275, partial [Bacteroidales bacterium]|nr:hypothetical protein [Bacteroidales bacterium]